MLRDVVTILGMVLIGGVLLAMLLIFYRGDLEQNTSVQGITEVLRVAAMESVDNSSRVERGELYITSKEEFENNFLNGIKTSHNIDVEVDEDSIEYSYLPKEADNASKNEPVKVKAIKVKMKDANNSEIGYQATVVVDIGESKEEDIEGIK